MELQISNSITHAPRGTPGGPAAVCNVPSRATANWSVRAAPPARAGEQQDGKCSLCFLTTLCTRSPAAASLRQCPRQRPPLSGVDQVGVDSASSKATRPASPMWLLQMCSSLSTGAPVALSDAASDTAPCHAKEHRESSVLYTPLPRSGGAGGSGGGVTPRGDTSRLHEVCTESALSLQA